MRVCVDAALAAAGIGAYARGMAAALGELPGVEVTLAAPDRPLGLAARVAWRERHLRRVDADVLLATAPELPLRRLPMPAVVVVHDVFPLSVPELTSRGQRLRFRTLLPRVLGRADAVVCVSEATRSDLRAALPGLGAAAAAAVVGQGPSPFPSLPGAPDEREPYLLYVGEAFPRKNLATLLRADLGGVRLVLAGPPPRAPLALPPHATHLGFVPEQRLAELYAGAAALVLPSLAEGFGRPVLDAMARGVPVIASDIPALREVTGGAAILVPDPLDPAAWSRAAAALPARAPDLSSAGRTRAEEFAWPRIARRMADVLESASR